MIRVGWYTYLHPRRPAAWRVRRSSSALLRMRYLDVAAWINRRCDDIHNELYHPARRYDVVVFLKRMKQDAQQAVENIQRYGGRTVFDLNVNYLEEWGEFPIPNTRPTPQQRADAQWMVTHVDHVVADSSALGDVAARYTDRVTVITDNVNLREFRHQKAHTRTDGLTLVWSGIANKGYHLRALLDVLPGAPGVSLLLISDAPPPVLAELAPLAPVAFRPFKPGRFPRDLLAGDAIISPRLDVNSYSIGHTEYKITTGMALGLPAIAARQRSYVEAVEDRGGGLLADTAAEWIAAIDALRDPAERTRRGALARQTVEARYSTAVVAERYAALFRSLARG